MRGVLIVALRWVWGLLEEAAILRPKKPPVLFRVKLIGAPALMAPVHYGDGIVGVTVVGSGIVTGAMLYDSNGLWPICKYLLLRGPMGVVSGDAVNLEVDELLMGLYKHRNAYLEKA